MFIGILLNVLVSFSVGVISFFTYWRAQRIASRYPAIALDSFARFWLAMFAVWMLIAAMDFLSYVTGEVALPQEFASLPIVIAYAFQIFVGFSVVMIARFINITALGGVRLREFMIIYWLLYGVFLAALYLYGVQPWIRNFFARQITGSNEVLAVFIVMFTPLWILGANLFLKTIREWRGVVRPVSLFLLLSSSSLMLIGVAGLLDEAGLVQGWMVTAARLGSMIGATLSYVAIFSLQDSKELVV